MITIDPLDDEVVKKPKPERSKAACADSMTAQQLPREGRSADREPGKKRSRLLSLALRLLRGGTGEEG